jgi:hypothetical protein
MSGFIATRLKRLEQKAAPGNPLDELTDEELDAAIAGLYEATRTETGMSPAELAIDLTERQKQGTPPDDLSPELVRQLVPLRLAWNPTSHAIWT